MNNNIIPIHQIGFPIDLEIIIPDDDSVKLLYEITEGLDYSKLYKAYSTKGRNPAIAPESLFRILVYGYMEGIYSSRGLEKACNRDINFRWLLQGQKAPDHNTIARFRSSRLSDCIEDLFDQLVNKLAQLNEIKFENVFVDGTKIEANANRYTFVWEKAIKKFEAKLQEKTRTTLESMKSDFNLDIVIPEDKIMVSYVKNFLVDYIKPIIKRDNITFVCGKGRRKSKLQKYTEALGEFIRKQTLYDDYNDIFDGRNSFSKTDHDATFMHMKEDHMKNGQLKPGYNVTIGVEAEYITGVNITSERSDQLTLIPLLDKMSKNLTKKYESVTADAGFESEENYTYLKNNNQTAYIKPQIYDKSKTRKFKRDISKRENMIYDEEGDCYVCAAGKKLLRTGSRIRRSTSGFESTVLIYECEDCSKCPYKSKCTKAKGNKHLNVSYNFIKLRENSGENIKTDLGILYRINRSIQVEGAFGIIKQDANFRRFLMRGKKNVFIEILLMAFGFDINKLHNKTMQNRNGQLLHKQQVS